MIWANIKDNAKDNFGKKKISEINSHGETYDFDRIMHYGPTAFSKSPQFKTIQPHKQTVKFGQRERLSTGDIRQTNKKYRCPGTV